MISEQIWNGKIEEVLNTAAAMQISEEWILIHDDVEDDSEERRGQLTLHKKYSFGHAVNAGDALFAIQQKAITNNFGVLSPKIAKNIADEFFLIMSRTTIGQGVEISYIKDKIVEYSDEDWFFIADSKSSYYTVAGPIRLGAIIAGATENQLNDLAEFGKNLGRSFQIIDDILDITSNFKGLKNQKGNDVYEGKRTLILGHLLRTIKGENKKKVIEIILKNRSYKSATEVDWVIQQMHLYGSIDYSKKIALKFKQKAEIVLDNKLKFLYKEPYINELRTLMNFVLERDH